MKLKKIHTIEELIKNIGEIPLCACGCGNKVNIDLKNYNYYIKHGYFRYLKNHSKDGQYKKGHTKGGTKFFTLEHREKLRQSQLGKKHTAERRLNESKSQIKFFKENPTARLKLSEIKKEYFKKNPTANPWYGKVPQKETTYGKGSHYASPYQGQVWLRSSYELAYAKYLDSIKEPWFYELETFHFHNFTYTPDFFLPRKELFVEVKGYMYPDSKYKIEAFQEEYPFDLQVLYRNDLIGLGIKL